MTAARAYDYDVVLLTDLRYPGGNSASLAEEVKAQARAGYRTALVHVRARHMSSPRTFNRRIAGCIRGGLADLVAADRTLRTRLLIVRQPQLFTHELEVNPHIEADVTVLVANQPPVDGLRSYYDVAAVHARACELFGQVEWAPIGPLVRNEIVATRAVVPLRGEDWVNVLDVADWRVDRSAYRGDRPVIGRHSRSHVAKWPVDRGGILAAYPDDDRVLVKILGGAEPAVAALGYQPANWTVYPFGSRSPQRFLAEIDVFVYYHHPGWIEAFGRNVIEAMASGCPVVLPPHFEPVFGDVCQYGPPAAAPALVEALCTRPQLYRERSELGLSHVEANYGTRTHARRVASLIGSPERRSVDGFPRRVRPSRRVLLVAAERTGIGSVTRLLRAAARFPSGVEPVLLTASPSLGPSREAGVLAELLPPESLGGAGEAAGRRIADAVRRHGADSVLLDAREPATGMAAASAAAAPTVWLRIAGREAQRGVRERFAAVVEVDDLLGAAGSVSPLRGLDDLRLQARDAARAALDVAPEVPLALLAPGADERMTSIPRVAVAAEALVQAGWTVVFPEPVLTTGETRLPAGVRRERLPALAPVLSAFDLVVTPPSHTIVHELLAARTPSLLVALRLDPGDEQRIHTAVARGIADGHEGFDGRGLAARLQELRDPARRRPMAAGGPLEDVAPRLLSALGIPVK